MLNTPQKIPTQKIPTHVFKFSTRVFLIFLFLIIVTVLAVLKILETTQEYTRGGVLR